jgi:acetyl-CoA acetyltransferase
MAGITDPRQETDLAELHAPFSYQELMLCEALGLCEKGKGGFFVEEGDYPVNPSGGALAANPIFAAGLIRLAEAATRIGDGLTAIAHATSGFCLQSNIVYVISSRMP